MFQRTLTALTLITLTACQATTAPAPQPQPPSGSALPRPSSCAVIESRNWQAWINAMPSVPPGGPTLIVTGELVLPTPGYKAVLSAGAADRSATPVQELILTLTPPDGPVAQVLTPTPERYEDPALSLQYGGVRILCGGAMLTEFTDVMVAR